VDESLLKACLKGWASWERRLGCVRNSSWSSHDSAKMWESTCSQPERITPHLAAASQGADSAGKRRGPPSGK
jgi:hypothetical protein